MTTDVKICLERTSFKKISSNPKAGIFSGSFFASIPSLNPVFWKVSWRTVNILIFHKIHKEIFCFWLELKGDCVTDKLTFRRKFSKDAQNKELHYAVISQNIPILGFEVIFLKEVCSSKVNRRSIWYKGCCIFLSYTVFRSTLTVFWFQVLISSD